MMICGGLGGGAGTRGGVVRGSVEREERPSDAHSTHLQVLREARRRARGRAGSANRGKSSSRRDAYLNAFKGTKEG